MGICKSNIQNEIEDFEPLQLMNTIKIKRLNSVSKKPYCARKEIKTNTYNYERTIYEIYLNEYNETLLKRVSCR